MATRQIVLDLDEDDWNTIQSEFAHRQSRLRDSDGALLPDGDSNLAGALVAEVFRDLEEYRDLFRKDQRDARG